MRLIFFALLFYTIPLPCISSNDSLALYRGWKPQTQSSLIICNANYRIKANQSPLSSGHGPALELGLNLGYFFSHKWLAGVYAGWGWRDLLWNTSYSKTYLNDFNAAFSGPSLTGNDSIVVNKMSSLMKGSYYYHDIENYAGIIFRLPYRWMPTVKIYTGRLSSEYKTGGTDRVDLKPYVASDKKYDNDYFSIDRNLKWGTEVTLYDGYTIIATAFDGTAVSKKKNLRHRSNLACFSFYFEQIDSYHSVFNYDNGAQQVSVPFDRVLTPSFLQKYKTEYNAGFRISFGLF